MMSNPMELAKFLKDQGIKEEDILKVLEGDETIMQQVVEKNVIAFPKDGTLERLEQVRALFFKYYV